jgi:microcystin-dependent protein
MSVLSQFVQGSETFPVGGIISWSGTITQLPGGWYLCDGGTYGGIQTPDLRNKFIVGSSGNGTGTATSPSTGPGFNATTGAISRNYTTHDIGGETAHQLTTAELASHSHTYNGGQNKSLRGDPAGADDVAEGYDIATGPAGGNQFHENRPPYYALAYIMKCESRVGLPENVVTTATLAELRLNGPLYDQELDGGAQKGNAGDVLTSLGAANGVRWAPVVASSVTYGVYTIGDQTIGGTKTFTSLISGSISGNAASATYATSAGSVNFANSSGTSSSCSGNAGTATKLLTARSINGVSFDGSSDITISATSTAIPGLGEGQTWQSFLGIRLDSTWYQNTTGRTIAVSIWTGTNQGALEVSTTPVAPGFQFGLSTGGSNQWATNTVPIPNGYFYRTLSCSFKAWNELR